MRYNEIRKHFRYITPLYNNELYISYLSKEIHHFSKETIMILSLIPIIVSTIISTFGIIFVIRKRENYGTILNTVLNVLLYLFFGLIFLPLYVFSTDVYLDQNIALLLWKISIIFWIISTSILSFIQIFVIKFKEVSPTPSIFYAFIGGLIVNLVFHFDAIVLQESGSYYSFVFNNLVLLIVLTVYNIMIISFMWYNIIINFSKFRDKKMGKNLGFLTLNFTIIIGIYSLHLIFQNILFEYLYLLVYLIGAFIASYNIYKKPALFIELTNMIYDFIIFHKSGILLYSYNFETGKETDDSVLKGSILIGINHILSSLVDKKEQLNLIKMKDRDIIFEYDNANDYAILLTTNHKNTFIVKAVRGFMEKFSNLYYKIFENMKGLIDVSEFRNAKDLILEYFAPYILNH